MRCGLLVLVLASAACRGEVYITRANVTALFGMAAQFTGQWARYNQEYRAGVRAAFAAANLYSVIDYELEDADTLTQGGAASLARRFEARNVFGLVGFRGDEAIAALGALSSPNTVPFIGAATGLSALRGDSAKGGVVNVRASLADEIGAIVQRITTDWNSAKKVAVFYQNDTYGLEGLAAVRKTLANMGLQLDSFAMYSVTDPLSAVRMNASIDSAIAKFEYSGAAPRAVIALATPAALKSLAERYKTHGGAENITFYGTSMTDPMLLSSSLTSAVSGMNILLTQITHPPRSSEGIVGDYRKDIGTPAVSFSALEGYVVGRLITDAMQRALVIYGWPVTRERFLNVIFRQTRTFDLSKTLLGPYGQICRGASDCWCNQGEHDVHLVHQLVRGAGYEEVPLSTVTFAGCGLSVSKGSITIVGQSTDVAGTIDSRGMEVRMGLSSAIEAFNSEANGNGIVLATMDDDNVPERTAKNVLELTSDGNLGDPLDNIWRTDVVPPLTSSISLVQKYLDWIALDAQGPLSLEGFVSGVFFGQALSAAQYATPESILEAVYDTGSFDLGGWTLGPFVDSCSGSGCCNQGSKNVWFSYFSTMSGSFMLENYSFSIPPCGVSYTGTAPKSNVAAIVGTVVPLVVIAVCVLLCGMYYMHWKKMAALMKENSRLVKQAQKLQEKLLGRADNLLNTPAETVIRTLGELRQLVGEDSPYAERIDDMVFIISQNKLYQANLTVHKNKDGITEEVDKEIEAYLHDTVLTKTGSDITIDLPYNTRTFCMVDDTQEDLHKILQWGFHPSSFDSSSSLVSVATCVFENAGFFDTFGVDRVKFNKWVNLVAQGYNDNPYHNSDHAADGVTSNFLVNTDDPLAIRYNGISVLENMHLATSIELFRQPDLNWLSDLPKKTWQEFYKLVTADLSNSMRPWEVYNKWTAQICHEFFLQGEAEKRLGLPVSPFMDKETTNIAKMQATFLEFIARPVAEGVVKVVPKAQVLLSNLNANLGCWQATLQAPASIQGAVSVSYQKLPPSGSIQAAVSVSYQILPGNQSQTTV
eukprot:m51a1_g1120 putative abc transporter permease (1044) ;mRNA; r:178759-183175